jgi:hypothetical protein
MESGLDGIESGLGIGWAGWAGSTGEGSGVPGGGCDGGWEAVEAGLAGGRGLEAARGLQKARKAGRKAGSDRREELNFQ